MEYLIIHNAGKVFSVVEKAGHLCTAMQTLCTTNLETAKEQLSDQNIDCTAIDKFQEKTAASDE